MFQAIGVLSQARLRIFRNTLMEGSIWRRIAFLGGVAFMLWMAFIIYVFSIATVSFLQGPIFARLLVEGSSFTVSPIGIVNAMPSSVLFFSLLGLLVVSFSNLLNSLYLSKDMELLLVAPIPIRAIFSSKFFIGLIVQYVLMFAMTGSFLLGYGQGRAYSWLYAVSVIIVLLLFPLIPAGIGSLLVMGIVRIVPARSARDAVGIFGGILATMVYAITQFTPEIPRQFMNIRNLPIVLDIDRLLLPSSWASQFLVAAGEGDIARWLYNGALFIGVSAVVFVICLTIAERIYYTGWSNMVVHGNRKTQATDSSALYKLTWLQKAVQKVLHPTALAIFSKDLRVFPRDMNNLQQIVFPLALVVVWIFRLLLNPQHPTGDLFSFLTTDSSLPSLMGGIAAAFMMCMASANTIASPNLSREGRAFWAIKTAPISPRDLLMGKFALAYLPYVIIGVPLLIIFTVLRQASLGSFLFSAGFLLLMGLGITCILLGLGAFFARFYWDNPNQQISMGTGCLFALISPLYLWMMLLALIGLPTIATALQVSPQTQLGVQIVGWVLAIGLTAQAVWGGLKMGEVGLERLEL